VLFFHITNSKITQIGSFSVVFASFFVVFGRKNTALQAASICGCCFAVIQQYSQKVTLWVIAIALGLSQQTLHTKYKRHHLPLNCMHPIFGLSQNHHKY